MTEIAATAFAIVILGLAIAGFLQSDADMKACQKTQSFSTCYATINP